MSENIQPDNNYPKWDKHELYNVLYFFFPIFSSNQGRRGDDCKICEELLGNIGENEPLTFSQTNQLLHLLHFGSISLGFFQYYFCNVPEFHVYNVDSIEGYDKSLFDNKNSSPITTIKTVQQLNWGLRRFHIDAVLFYGNINRAFNELRNKEKCYLEEYFKRKRFHTSSDFKIRGGMFKFRKIEIHDKYLISEVAYKAITNSSFKKYILGKFEIHNSSAATNIVSLSNLEEDDEPSTFKEVAKTIGKIPNLNKPINSKEDIEEIHEKIIKRVDAAKQKAIENFKLYLSITQQLDIYIATSMRVYDDFKNLSDNLDMIFDDKFLKGHNIRYFDPTNSASENHEDKGLAECLMVNCAKILVYFAGENDSFGKDSEAAIALSLGKPVIILCPDTPKGKIRQDIFKDVHPLTRLTTIVEGVACGALVTQCKTNVMKILRNLIQNEMEYELQNGEGGLFRVIEKTTQCTYRIQTNNELLAAVFWNNYNEQPIN